MNKEMMKALEDDGEKLRQMTDEDHGPFIICHDGSFCSDQWCVRLGCEFERSNGESVTQKSEG